MTLRENAGLVLVSRAERHWHPVVSKSSMSLTERFALSIRHAQRLDKGQDPRVESREPIPREAFRKTGAGLT
jgi:hypothetical protein